MKKGYDRIYAQIDLDAIRENLLSIKAHLNPEMKLCAVVKADGYGHGAEQVAEVTKDLVWGFAVATPDEGILLRKRGIENPILLLGHVKTERYEEMIEHEIRLPLFETEKVKAFSEAALKLGKTGYYHVKVDTGMGRIGLLPDEAGLAAVEEMVQYPGVKAEGIFTHLATADMIENEPALVQNRKFLDFILKLIEKKIVFPIIHSANSAATILFEGLNLSMSRVGVALYGLCPSDEYDWMATPLKPAMSLYTEVIYTKTLPAGYSIGYGGTFVTQRESRIATLSVGYADGYARSLSNKGEVLIHGRRCPIVGKVCMDQMMVDITDLPDAMDVKEGDRVTLIGRDGDECITMEELGKLSGRFNYEFVCDISKRVPRVFMMNGEEVDSIDMF